MGARPIIGLAGLLLLAGGIVLQFFVILSGGVNKSPINEFYFLQADTSKINGAQPLTRWTYFALCGVDENGRDANCGKAKAALPFDPPRNFGTQDNIPQQFVDHHKTYYYLSRFMFAFYLIALFFAVCSLFTGLLAVCSRLGGYFSGFITFIALFFQMLAAALQTSWVVKGRNNFNSNGQTATIGVKSMGFAWGAVGCFLVAMVLFCSGGRKHKETVTTSRRSFWRRGRSGKRGSFIDSESQRRVKDDY